MSAALQSIAQHSEDHMAALNNLLAKGKGPQGARSERCK
jgi:hypothetical protein